MNICINIKTFWGSYSIYSIRRATKSKLWCNPFYDWFLNLINFKLTSLILTSYQRNFHLFKLYLYMQKIKHLNANIIKVIART